MRINDKDNFEKKNYKFRKYLLLSTKLIIFLNHYKLDNWILYIRIDKNILNDF